MNTAKSTWQTTPPPLGKEIYIIATIARTHLSNYDSSSTYDHDLYTGIAISAEGEWLDHLENPVLQFDEDTLVIHAWADLPNLGLRPGEALTKAGSDY